MIYAFCRRIFLIFINLFLLSVVSYSIFMRDPSNSSFSEPHFFSGYFSYIGNLLKGDLGITYNGGDSLNSVIFSVFPPTLELCFFAIFLAFLFGVPVGISGAFNKKHICGKTINALSSFGVSVPVFWIAPILLYFTAVYRWEISAVGQYNVLYEIPSITGFAAIDVWFMDVPYRIKVIQNVFQHLALPTLVLAISPTMEITKLVQQRTEWILSQNYVKFSMTKGWSNFTILRRYVFRNTLPVLIPEIPRLITFTLALSMLIETTFAWPGIGRWLILAMNQQDYNSIAVGVIIIGLFIITVNILADFGLFLLDPFGKKGWLNNAR
ncbi:ABC transporter permease [Lonepinella sp. MS14435]|uniref:ABC transporter permease n=1 Tax=unclassified Lonepinella TaxID=2642006 RepID=UPI0036DDDA77